MESLKLIKNRIQSITSTRQITQSMRLVSTSKMQKARVRMEVNQPFLQATEKLTRIAAKSASSARHPYLQSQGESTAAVIVITGDRGLCGGYNINVSRYADELIQSLNSEVRIVSVGQKARDFYRRRYKEKLAHSITGISENPFYDDVKEIAAQVQGWYDHAEIGQIYLVYTQFETMLVQTPVAKRLLPLDIDGLQAKDLPNKFVRCEPSGDSFLTNTVSFYLASSLFGAILESACCEQSARITSMDAAVKNADEMIEALTLSYNQARQSTITQEIIEIVGGADAV